MPRRDTLPVVIFLLAAVVLLTLPRQRQLAISNLVQSTVLAPMLQLQTWLSDNRAMSARIEALRAERDAATTKVVKLQGVEEEVVRLRLLLDLSERAENRFSPANLYPAGRASQGIRRSFILDLGTSAGVTGDAAVVAPAGLVGIVRAATRWQATGDFWTHPVFRVSAMTADGRVFGIMGPLAGQPPRMQLDGAPYQLELEPGTELVTSGMGGLFPRGIPIGRVAESISAREGWERSYLVEPAVYPDAVREVMVLVDRDAPDVDVTEVWRHPAEEDDQR